jgi:hypothetical protein
LGNRLRIAINQPQQHKRGRIGLPPILLPAFDQPRAQPIPQGKRSPTEAEPLAQGTDFIGCHFTPMTLVKPSSQAVQWLCAKNQSRGPPMSLSLMSNQIAIAVQLAAGFTKLIMRVRSVLTNSYIRLCRIDINRNDTAASYFLTVGQIVMITAGPAPTVGGEVC